MLNLLRYCSKRLRYREFKDFIDMGLGIEARQRRCKQYWRRHLQLCREFQAEAFAKLSSANSIAILGAGRLLDINCAQIEHQFKEVLLLDADPLCLSVWRDWQASADRSMRFNFSISELTNSLLEWDLRLRRFIRAQGRTVTTERLALFLSELRPNKAFIAGQRFDCVLSANVLSQIPIFWRDRVHNMLKRFCRLDTDAQGLYNPDLQSALELSMCRLQEQHLRSIEELKPSLVVISYDTSFMYYHPQVAEWMDCPALYLTAELSFKDMSLCARNSWLWHIAPFGVEQPDHGAIHQVEARAFLCNF